MLNVGSWRTTDFGTEAAVHRIAPSYLALEHRVRSGAARAHCSKCVLLFEKEAAEEERQRQQDQELLNKEGSAAREDYMYTVHAPAPRTPQDRLPTIRADEVKR